jgi:Integrase core domain
VAVVLDCFSRRIVGWSMADHLRTELVLDALDMAISQRQPAPGLVHHADHGCQYTSLAFGRRLREAGLVASMGTWVTRWTTPWPRASSPPWNASCWTATPGPPEPGCARRCSTTSRSSTTVNAATRPSTTSHPSATRSSTHQQHLLHSHRVHESGATPQQHRTDDRPDDAASLALLAGAVASTAMSPPAIRQQLSLTTPHVAPAGLHAICFLSSADIGKSVDTHG